MILLLVSFVAGLLTVLAPCVLPLLPVIVGGSIGGGKSIRRAITVTAALTISVIVFTLLIKASTILIGIPQHAWQWFSGGIIILFGLVTLFPTLWEKIPLMSKMSVGSNQLLASGYQKHNLAGDILVGAALGPVFSTCSPTYFLVLAAVLPENFLLGLTYLIAYSIGLSLALLLIAFIGQRIVDAFGIAANPHGKFKKVLGILFLLVGIAIITGFDKQLQTQILDAGFFDVTKVEQKLLDAVPLGGSSSESQSFDTSSADKKKNYKLAPEISSPDGFVNTDGKPITLTELRGKVVLLDIWTYSCINCQRTIPYLNDWYKKYKDQGFEIVGLHTPEFAFERLLPNVEKATRQFGIEYPVVLDNDYSTWNAYGNLYWPRKYLIDPDGYIIYDHVGEGGYEETEQEIQKALAVRNAKDIVTSPNISKPIDVIDMDRTQIGSPEIYFGSERNTDLANGPVGLSGTRTMTIPNTPAFNKLYLGGTWNISGEFAETSGPSTIVFPYKAKNVYIVAGSDAGTEIAVYKDDVFVKKMTVRDEMLYSLINDPDYGQHTLRIEVEGSGLKAFTFTFG